MDEPFILSSALHKFPTPLVSALHYLQHFYNSNVSKQINLPVGAVCSHSDTLSLTQELINPVCLSVCLTAHLFHSPNFFLLRCEGKIHDFTAGV